MHISTKTAFLIAAGFFGMIDSVSATLISQNLGDSAYTSSSNWGSSSPSAAFDGTVATGGWNAGAHPTQWIEVNLAHVYSISQIDLYSTMQPMGSVTHLIYTSLSPILTDLSQATLAVTISENTGTAFAGYPNWSESLVNPISAQYVQIRTTQSPSWVAWREIQVFDTTPAASVPEMDGVSGTGALALVAFGLALAKEGRSRRKQAA